MSNHTKGAWYVSKHEDSTDVVVRAGNKEIVNWISRGADSFAQRTHQLSHRTFQNSQKRPSFTEGIAKTSGAASPAPRLP